MRWWWIIRSFIMELFNRMFFIRGKSRIRRLRWFFLSSSSFTPLRFDMERETG
jgi:hypothetical protein